MSNTKLNGSDDSRWAPGETAIDALTRERDTMRDRAEKAEAKLKSLGELVSPWRCTCDDCGKCLRCRIEGLVKA